MKYYQHHIGDYAAATAYLSLMEDAIYTRLLRVYYRDEKPLPCETKSVAWLIGLRMKKEKALLEKLLPQFFTLQDDGWHCKRADEEIARYRDKQEKSKAAIDARWGKAKEMPSTDTDSQVHTKQQDTDVSQASYVRITGVLPTNNQQPLTNNHEPLTNNQQTDTNTGASPVLERAQAHATPTADPPVDNFPEPHGLAVASIAEPQKTHPVSQNESLALPAEPVPLPAKPAEPVKPARKAANGTRLPEDWRLPKAWGDWALAKRSDFSAEDVRNEAECFADYWIAKAGINARKLDWEKTWHNWIRNAKAKPRAKPVRYTPGDPIPLVRGETMQSAEMVRALLFTQQIAPEHAGENHAEV